MMIGVLDYGAGNLKNVARVLEHFGYRYLVITKENHFNRIDKLIIPGVGAFAVAMQKLGELALIEPIEAFAKTGKLILGICLGMQLLFEQSDEFGDTKGLGLLSGSVRPIPNKGSTGQQHKIPHIGWNELIPNIFSEYSDLIKPKNSVYFVHSYMAQPERQNEIVAYCDYNGIQIPAMVSNNNILGCQFHPEKSGQSGLSLFKEILEIK